MSLHSYKKQLLGLLPPKIVLFVVRQKCNSNKRKAPKVKKSSSIATPAPHTREIKSTTAGQDLVAVSTRKVIVAAQAGRLHLASPTLPCPCSCW